MEDHKIELEGIIVDVDSITKGSMSVIRITLKSRDGIHTIFDESFHPYFYLLPFNKAIEPSAISGMQIPGKEGTISIMSVEEVQRSVKGKEEKVLRVYTQNARDVPTLSEKLQEFGQRYEYDILFWKRYLIDMRISPLAGVKVHARSANGAMYVDKIEAARVTGIPIKQLCFDIETYNPAVNPRPEVDPVIMISYETGDGHGVLTTKQIDREFIKVYKNEKEMLAAFANLIKEMDPDAIAGYNSSNFDLPYLLKRSKANKLKFDITRYGDEEPRTEHHGLVEAVKIPGRANVDIYNVTRFVSIVGASDKLLKINRFTLGEVYRAVTGDNKITVDKKNIWQIWDGSTADREELADYSLSDSITLNKLYEFFIPLEIEISKICGTSLAEACVSTTGQLVEYVLMRYANDNNEMIPNKPSDSEIINREAHPIEGAYVKTPEAGIYDNIVVFDFRGLYPSIIIANNIDPSTVCIDCTDFYRSPTNVKFRKQPEGIVPKALRLMIAERTDVKKAYKKDPDNKNLAARSNGLKIIANSFYGYLGYARSRWYSRDCAASVTAYGREAVADSMSKAEKSGFKVLYADTDSNFLLMQNKTRDDAMVLLKKINSELPGSMELELEDFYLRGVFVGKKGGDVGAKKKYALLSESGRIKIRGFELVRRDWSNIARETQRKVLEAILKEGSKEKAIAIVKDVVQRLKSGDIELKDLVIYTQLRKRIDHYDSKSPELAAAKKAIQSKHKRQEDLEGSTIGYIITKDGNSISDKAVLEDVAKNYDPDYYINHQVIPATLKILKELGYKEEELRGGGSQRKL
ncbi:MAG: ribonuclease H-like domain-containing protein [Candidatus Micrarchaeota archaeon]|nr:ribonuclease H-like domain-containing protein [Candidatus Micrarchaeota archaeon]